MSSRRKYDKQFKIDAIQLCETSEKSIAEVARDLGIHPNRLYRWKDELLLHNEKSFPGNGRTRDEEFNKIKRENAELKMERDILKKALAIFSKTENKFTNL